MTYVIVIVAIVVVLIFIQRYRRKHSAVYFYPRSRQRMDEAELMLERLGMRYELNQLSQQDVIAAEKKMKDNAKWQMAQAVPDKALFVVRSTYAEVYEMYALRLHDLAYNGGRGLAEIDAYIEARSRATWQRAEQQVEESNNLMRELGLPTRTLEEWNRYLGG